MSEYSPDPDERSVMRIYLQRMEVRLSTMHRIAGVFLNGAGLLVLFPVLFRDTVGEIHTFVLEKLLTSLPGAIQVVEWSQSVNFVTYLILFPPFAISLFIPLYAFYFLIKDIVQFYFLGHSPGFPDDPFVPRFSLAAIAFSRDESEKVKQEVMRLQYGREFINLIVPLKREEAGYFDSVYKHTDGLVIPPTRKPEVLRSLNVFSSANQQPNEQDINRLNTALGLAGLIDSRLIEEVARMELSLTRNAIHLRRLVLRYTKALMLVIWTTLVSFVIAASIDNLPPLSLLSSSYIVWSVVTPLVVKRPIKWIWRLSDQHTSESDVNIDGHLVGFERIVVNLSKIVLMLSLFALVLAIIIEGTLIIKMFTG